MESYTIKNLTFTYPDRKTPALKNLSFAIRQGEFIVLCGPSGCGKTTLLRHLKPVLMPHGLKSGEILFEDKLLTSLEFAESSSKIGFVMQSPDNQIITDKVWHELAFGLESLGYDTPAIRRRVAEMASFFGIQTWFHQSVSELSGGQKQVLNLAAIMTLQPSVLILDEPTSQLDPIAAAEFLGIVGKINRELGTTVILTEHRLEEAFPLAGRVLVMDKGEIICDGTPGQVGMELHGLNHGMFAAMTVPMRVYAAVDSDDLCPVSVREGREWLGRQLTIDNGQLTIIKEEEVSRFRGELSQVGESAEVRGQVTAPPGGFAAAPLASEGGKDLPSEVNLAPLVYEGGVSEADGGSPAVELDGVWFRYGRDLPDVVCGVSFRVYPGEITAVLGGNGVGKTTALTLISGINKPYRGQVRVNGSIAALPQNPQVLFVKKTVAEDLAEMLRASKLSKEEKQERVSSVATLCGLAGLLDFHPYDLSGGEQQKAALAKVLLLRPQILLLDEPTKGLDAEFKQTFAAILRGLAGVGVTVLMISHDIEFCAEYADRCALFFDGDIVSEGAPREFFSGNSFYTTAASRMSRQILADAVTADDIITALGGRVQGQFTIHNSKFTIKDGAEVVCADKAKPEEEIKAKLPLWRLLMAGLSGACLLAALVFALMSGGEMLGFISGGDLAVNIGAENGKIWKYIGIIAAALVFAVLMVWALNRADRSLKMPATGQEQTVQLNTQNSKLKTWTAKQSKLPKRTLVAMAMILVAIPLTIYLGSYYFGDRKYYFVSILVVLESMLPFALIFESRKPQARELITIAVLCAIAVAGRAAFFMLPQFKPVVALVIIAAVAFGGEAGFLVGAMTGFVSNIFFGQGPWTPYQMFAFGLIGFLAGLCFKKGILGRTRPALGLFGFITTFLIYGGIMNPVSVLMFQGQPTKEMFYLAYLQGIPFDLIHALATVVFLAIAARPMLEKLDRIKTKYGLVE